MSRRRWVIALFLAAEALVVLSHPEESKEMFRKVYYAGWKLLPIPEGAERPTR